MDAPISGPRIADKNFTDTGIFLNFSPPKICTFFRRGDLQSWPRSQDGWREIQGQHQEGEQDRVSEREVFLREGFRDRRFSEVPLSEEDFALGDSPLLGPP